jgi:hypothetical protein
VVTCTHCLLAYLLYLDSRTSFPSSLLRRTNTDSFYTCTLREDREATCVKTVIGREERGSSNFAEPASIVKIVVQQAIIKA